jgi:predicted DCC family thiol-disulfide oxidoreductase YuxK
MNVAENSSPDRGWILYDGECPFCRNMAARFRRPFEARGFGFTPLQTPWVAAAIDLQGGERPSEMRVWTNDGRDLGGAEAVVFLAGFVWWGKPLGWCAKLPGAKIILRKIYREIAARRSCDGGACQLRNRQT